MTSLAVSPLFSALADPALSSLEAELSHVRLKSGETLFAAGEPGDSLYVVVFGRLRAVLPEGPRGHQVLGEIGRGETVGEMALLTGERRSATVYAIRDTELIKLTKTAFERAVERQPKLMLEMTRLIIARYHRVVYPVATTQPVAFAVVPCDASVRVEDVTNGLVRALSSTRKVLALDLERLQRERGAPGDEPLDLESPELAGWLHEQELQHDYVVYAADPRSDRNPTGGRPGADQASAWTKLCVRQADMVLLVGTMGAAPTVDPSVLEMIGRGDGAVGPRRELILLYDSTRQTPDGTAEWLARVPVTFHHHVDPRLTRDYERLTRLLSGRAIGLVLGGGGARGLAHIGVIRALEEAHIPIDLVGGTSIGAIIGGQYALGWDSARIRSESRRVLVDDGSLNDYTVPIMALLHGKRFSRMLCKLFGDRRIEDLPLFYYCVSTNLTRSTSVAHRTGPMCKWVSASMAVPGLGPPIFDGRDILVDGGVVNNLPVDFMRGFGRGPVFASSVSPRVEMRLDREYPDIPSPWRVLLSWVNPFGSPMRVPRINNILMRTVSLQQITSGAEGHDGADLVFEPPCAAHKLLDWQSLDSIVETGYRSAVTAIEQWQAQHRPTAS